MNVKGKLLDAARISPVIAVGALYALKLINRIKERRLLGPYRGIGPGGGTGSEQYCYDVWLNHLTRLRANGWTSHPKVVAELGPGNSIGTGLAVLLSGSEKYFALDVVPYSQTERNLTVFEGITGLFHNRARNLEDVVPAPQLQESLREERLHEIRDAITKVNFKTSGISIYYFVPWNSPEVIRQNSVDLIFSQSVLEHVSDISAVYAAMYQWLKPGGFMSHLIDFGSHGKSIDWNGYWMYPEYLWKLIGKEYINRQPLSRHLEELERHGFRMIGKTITRTTEGILRKHLAPRWKYLSDEDLTCSGAFLQFQKPE